MGQMDLFEACAGGKGQGFNGRYLRMHFHNGQKGASGKGGRWNDRDGRIYPNHGHVGWDSLIAASVNKEWIVVIVLAVVDFFGFWMMVVGVYRSLLLIAINCKVSVRSFFMVCDRGGLMIPIISSWSWRITGRHDSLRVWYGRVEPSNLVGSSR